AVRGGERRGRGQPEAALDVAAHLITRFCGIGQKRIPRSHCLGPSTAGSSSSRLYDPRKPPRLAPTDLAKGNRSGHIEGTDLRRRWRLDACASAVHPLATWREPPDPPSDSPTSLLTHYSAAPT